MRDDERRRLEQHTRHRGTQVAVEREDRPVGALGADERRPPVAAVRRAALRRLITHIDHTSGVR